MIINPIVAAAAVAARAVGGGQWLNRPEPSTSRDIAFPENQYFSDMEVNDVLEALEHHNFADNIEDDLHEQSRELDEFIADEVPDPVITPIDAKDAEILSKEEDTSQHQSTIKPPPLPNTNNPFVLLNLEREADFDTVRRAYKEMVKIYHPDVVAGPDASADDRKAANWDFARINAAFDILKRRENEEILDYTVYVDGQPVTRSVDVSEEARLRDPYRIDYDRIIENRRRYPQERMWYEPGYHDYHSSGFEVDAANEVDGSQSDPYSRGRWWDFGANVQPDHWNNGFGPIPSAESRWEERTLFEQEGRRHSGFGVNPRPDHLWDGEHAFGFEAAHGSSGNHEYQPRSRSQRFDAQMSQGYPYKDTVWNEMHNFDDVGSVQQDGIDSGLDFDPLEGKWWREDDPAFGDFAP